MSIITARLLVLFLAVLSASPLFAQSVSGTITGYVFDSSDAPVANANVTATNVGTGTQTARTTDQTGRFLITNLQPGDYRLSVEASGFRRFLQESIALRIDSTVRIDARLQVGGVSEPACARRDAHR